MPTFDLTHHAAVRAQQRGVPNRLLDTLIENADIDAPIGSGCRLLRVSRQRLQVRAVRKVLGSEVDRLARLAVIWSDKAGAVVTSCITTRDAPAGATGRFTERRSPLDLAAFEDARGVRVHADKRSIYGS